MKISQIKRVTILTVLSLFSICGVFGSGSNSTSAKAFMQNQKTNEQAEQTVDETYKNIQVLKGLPASQIRPLMNYISASLGVNCASCHVRNGNVWEFEKDDKKNKQTARKMIQMTMDLNKNSFDGKMHVTCYTCHKGAGHPDSIPPLPRVSTRGGNAAGGPWPTPKQVLDKYVLAVGGAEAAERIKTLSLKGENTASNGQKMTLEIFYASPEKASLKMTAQENTFTQVFNGMKGWVKNPFEDREMDAVDIIRTRSMIWSLQPLQLKMPYPRMTFSGAAKIRDRDCHSLKMTLPDKRTALFYFDVETGFLLRRVIETITPVGIDPEQTDYDDYREVDGLKMPFSIVTSYLDNFFSSTRKFSEIRANQSLDESVFALPGSK